MREREIARLKARLAKVPGIQVTPKHTTLASEIRRLIGSEICLDCLLPVVKGSGRLIDGRCGTCAVAWDARFDDLRAPHSAA